MCLLEKFYTKTYLWFVKTAIYLVKTIFTYKIYALMQLLILCLNFL